ncbi:hypothetical protein ABZ864_43105 [Streptomyces sp. NPDC047082]|uniref:hypothetical protein n=1 Tax=Streptomyces sp. NPDC047082 TaxID=3155259 RepID=UPI00340ADF13
MALRTRFPDQKDRFHPTRLGNVLAVAEESAGQEYGFDPPVVWPRLYALLSPQLRRTVNERRTTLDAAAAMCIYATVAAVVASPLTAIGRPVQNLWAVLAPAALAMASYRTAQNCTLSYAMARRTAFDLHRFDLYTALHLPLPRDRDEERAMNRALGLEWRQGVRMRTRYDVAPDAAALVGEAPTETMDLAESVTRRTYQHPRSADQADEEVLRRVEEGVREALTPPVPTAFRGAVGAAFANLEPTSDEDGTPVWRLPAGEAYTLVVALALGWQAYESPDTVRDLLPAGALTDGMLVTAGQSEPLVDLDVQIEAPFASVRPPQHAVRLGSGNDTARLTSVIRVDEPGELDLRIGFYTNGRLVHVILLDLYATDDGSGPLP